MFYDLPNFILMELEELCSGHYINDKDFNSLLEFIINEEDGKDWLIDDDYDFIRINFCRCCNIDDVERFDICLRNIQQYIHPYIKQAISDGFRIKVKIMVNRLFIKLEHPLSVKGIYGLY